MEIKIENLDCMSPEELLKYEYYLREQAMNISRLRHYACLRGQSVYLRLNGQIAKAQDMDKSCEAIYKTLAEDYRW